MGDYRDQGDQSGVGDLERQLGTVETRETKETRIGEKRSGRLEETVRDWETRETKEIKRIEYRETVRDWGEYRRPEERVDSEGLDQGDQRIELGKQLGD